jgi:hypothetical protein
MVYSPPAYPLLQTKTENLQGYFNNISNRYLPDKLEILTTKAKALETKYKNKVKNTETWFKICNKELRLDQAACIGSLVDLLPMKGDKKALNDAQMILLGAIFYRFKRIAFSYQSSYFFTDPNASVFYRILREDFHLDKLDDETLATCCEAYQNYLKTPYAPENKNEGEIVGDLFPYIKNDCDFYLNLEQIVNEAKINAQPIRIQLQVLSFISSVADALKQTDADIFSCLPHLSQIISTILEEKTSLPTDQIIVLARGMKPKPTERTLAVLKLCLPAHISNKKLQLIDGTTLEMTFENYVHQALEISSHYTLLGAYLMALGRCTPETRNLKSTLNDALETKGNNQLDDSTRELALTALKNYMAIPHDLRPVLDCKTWDPDGGEDHMIRDLDNRLRQLVERDEEKRKESILSF